MQTLYLDVFSGISGDMFIGSLLDLGVDLHALEYKLAKLDLDGYHLHASRQQRSNIEGIKFDVHLAHEHDDHSHTHEHRHGGTTHIHAHSHTHPHAHGPHESGHSHHHDHDEHSHDEHDDHDHHDSRDFAEIQRLIRASELSDWVKDKAVAVFRRIAVAEGKIHGHPPEEVHFHEVGAVDSIVDIVGACLGLEMLGRPRVLAAPVVEGTGWVTCAHGRFPVPTAATLEILGARGVAVTQCEEPHELVTPTGAALLAEFAESFGPMQNLVAHKVGYGLGTRENQTRPNVLRAVLGEVIVSPAPTPAVAEPMPGASAPNLGSAAVDTLDWQHDTIAVIETNLDDTNAEILGAFVEQTLAAGALDVFHTPIQMKKNRPGVLLTVLCAAGDADRFTELMLRETSAFGVRRHFVERRKLRREIRRVTTPHGEVEVKLGWLAGAIIQSAPEYESCRRVAAAAQVPLKQVYAAALRALEL